MFDRITTRSRGFGFVTFADYAVGQRLVQMGHLPMRPNKFVEIKPAEPKSTTGRYATPAATVVPLALGGVDVGMVDPAATVWLPPPVVPSPTTTGSGTLPLAVPPVFYHSAGGGVPIMEPMAAPIAAIQEVSSSSMLAGAMPPSSYPIPSSPFAMAAAYPPFGDGVAVYPELAMAYTCSAYDASSYGPPPPLPVYPAAVYDGSSGAYRYSSPVSGVPPAEPAASPF